MRGEKLGREIFWVADTNPRGFSWRFQGSFGLRGKREQRENFELLPEEFGELSGPLR